MELNNDDETLSQWFHQHRKQITLDLMAGTVSGICNCVSAMPMDTIKVRMQLSTDSFTTILVNTFREEGALAFFKGMQFPLIAVPLINACVFTTYEFWCRLLKCNDTNNRTYSKIGICGMAAGMAAGLISSPIELAKIRLQQQHTKTKGPFQIMANIIRKDGLKGPFRGHFATQSREIVGYGAQFITYAVVQDLLQNNGTLSHTGVLIAGGCAGIGCWAFSYPQDTIKTIIQGDKMRKYKLHQWIPDGGFIDCFKEVVKTEGYRGLWKGFTGTCFRAFYANAVGFYAYEISKRFFIQNLQILN